ncbi:MAG: hypothetical protein ACQXXJ_09175 [Candidatus Bathyarchaeia archaeon]
MKQALNHLAARQALIWNRHILRAPVQVADKMATSSLFPRLLKSPRRANHDPRLLSCSRISLVNSRYASWASIVLLHVPV